MISAPPLSATLLHCLAKFYPVDHAMLGPAGATEFVTGAIARARSRGFGSDQDIERYFELMLVLGAGFDDDPQLPWASEALRGTSTPFMPKLWQLAINYVQKDAGSDGSHYRRALLRAKRLTAIQLTSMIWTEPSQADSMLRALHPEKYWIVQKEIALLFSCAKRHAQHHEPDAGGVRPLYVVLMFLLGSHFEADLRYQWASTILAEMALPIRARYEKLHRAALSQLDAALTGLGSDAL